MFFAQRTSCPNNGFSLNWHNEEIHECICEMNKLGFMVNYELYRKTHIQQCVLPYQLPKRRLQDHKLVLSLSRKDNHSYWTPKTGVFSSVLSWSNESDKISDKPCTSLRSLCQILT